MNEPRCQALLRAKLDALFLLADLPLVFGDRYDALSWREAMGNIGLAVPLGLASPGRALDADKHHDISTRVSRLLNGKRPIAWGQLVALAEHAGLDRFLGSAEAAASQLADAVPVHDFTRRLFETRWAHPAFAERALFGTRHLLLAAFGRFPSRQDGLRVGPDIVIAAAPPGPIRGSRLPQPEDLEEDLLSFRLGTRLKARLERVGAARALVLLEVRPAPEKPHGYAVACLAPSPLAPRRLLPPGNPEVLPTRPYHGIDAFILDQPLGRHDWLALLTPEPLALPWPTPDDALHEPSPTQLADLLRALDGAAKRDKDAVEVRHAAFMAVAPRGDGA